MHSIIYLVGIVVVVLFALSFPRLHYTLLAEDVTTQIGSAPVGPPPAGSSTASATGASVVEWGAVFAGAVLAVAIAFVLLAFAAAIALSAASPWPNSGPNSGVSAKVIASVAVFWAMAQQIGAFVVGQQCRWHQTGHEVVLGAPACVGPAKNVVSIARRSSGVNLAWTPIAK